MNIVFSFVCSSLSYYFKENLIPSLTTKQMQIIGIAAIAFGCLAVCYAIMRSCGFTAKYLPDLEDAEFDPNLETIPSLNDKTDLFDKQQMTEQELNLHIIKLYPMKAMTCVSSRNTLLLNGKHKMLARREMTQQEFYLKLIKLKPNLASAYIALAKTLPYNGMIKLFNGLEMTKEELNLRAVEINYKKLVT